MKKQTMSLAVASALLVGGSSAFGTMYINDRGLGEALIYPYYSAANSNDTYIHVVNTTDKVKAVKVRFIEAQNSAEVLDFNLYLSPFDEWAGAITKDPNGEGGAIRTADTSCTVPALGQPNNGFDGTTEELEDGTVVRTQPFVNFAYLEDKASGTNGFDNTGIERSLEGYVEIIEMGQLDSDEPPGWPFSEENLESWLQDDGSDKGWAATHDETGVPNGCSKLELAWEVQPAGVWVSTDGEDELLSTWDGGGLYGYGVLINVEDGTSAGYDATAIEGFADPVITDAGDLHFEPGDENPSLQDADNFIYVSEDGQTTEYEMDSGEDAVSGLLMTATLANDFVADEGRRALTDWVITQPTKKFYVNGDDAVPPYTNEWDGQKACETVEVGFFDREELFTRVTEGPGFSPRPPQSESPDFELCTEVSVVSFGVDSAVRATDAILYGFNGFLGDVSEGWAVMDFTSDSDHYLESADGNTFNGLPVTGVAVQLVRNDNADDAVPGVLASYAAAVEHKTVISVESSPVTPPSP